MHRRIKRRRIKKKKHNKKYLNKKKNKNKNKREKKLDSEDDENPMISNLNFLDEATRFLKPLQEMFHTDVETHLAAFEISKRKSKPLLMLQSVLRMQHIDKSNANVLEKVSYLKDFILSERELRKAVLNVLDRIQF